MNWIEQNIRSIDKVSTEEQTLIIAIEEMSELSKVLTKRLRQLTDDRTLRNKPKREEMLEEISDVEICLERLKQRYDINSEYLNIEIKSEKIRRTLNLFEKGK